MNTTSSINLSVKERLLYIFMQIKYTVVEFFSSSIENTKTAITESYVAVKHLYHSSSQLKRKDFFNLQAGNIAVTFGIANLVCCFFVPLTLLGWGFNLLFSWALIKTGTNTLRLIKQN